MDKFEKRFYNSSLKMNEAMLEMLETKNFSEVTVSDLCRKSGVNRSTFYSHYSNTFDLLQEIKDRMISDFVKSFEGLGETNDIANYIDNAHLNIYLTFIKNNIKLFRTAAINMNAEIFNKVFEFIRKGYLSYGITDENYIYYSSRFYLQGINAIVTEWVKRGCSDTVEYVASVIKKCVLPYFSAAEAGLQNV